MECIYTSNFAIGMGNHGHCVVGLLECSYATLLTGGTHIPAWASCIMPWMEMGDDNMIDE